MAETNKLSPEQRAIMLERVRAGESYRSIADDLGVTLQAVSFHARKVIGPKRTSKIAPSESIEIAKRFQRGERATALAQEYGVGLTTIRSHIERVTGVKPGRNRRSVGVNPPVSISDRAYIAALVDGEGCISVCRSGSHHGWQVSITNTSEPLRASLADLGGRFYFPKREKSWVEGKGLREQVWVWKIGAAWDVHRFLVAIEPFMRIKRQKAIETIVAIENKFGAPPSDGRAHLVAATILDGAFNDALRTTALSRTPAPPLRAGQLRLGV